MSTHVADEPRTSSAAPFQTTVFETDAQLKKHLDRTPASIKQLIIRFGIGASAAAAPGPCLSMLLLEP